jgi:hypothetical protein
MEVCSPSSVFDVAPAAIRLRPDPAARVNRIKTSEDDLHETDDAALAIRLEEQRAQHLRAERREATRLEREAQQAEKRRSIEARRAAPSAGVRKTWADPRIAESRMRRYAARVGHVLYPSLAVAMAALVPGFRGISGARLELLADPRRRGVVGGFEVELIEVDREGWPLASG